MLTLWCSVLAMMCSVSQLSAKMPTWLREMIVSWMKTVNYQPQLESFKADRLTARSAISVIPKGKTTPLLGAVWFDARVFTDRETKKQRRPSAIHPTC
jgi:hypothetical protein